MKPARHRSKAVFVLGETAAVAALLFVVTLFVASFVRVASRDLGFDRSAVVAIALGRDGGDAGALLDLLGDVPGTSIAAALSGTPPLMMEAFGGDRHTVSIEPVGGKAGQGQSSTLHAVTPHYFDTMRIQLVAGRLFAPSDAGRPVAIIDSGTARTLFETDRQAIGRQLLRGTSTPPVTVVGIVRQVRAGGPEQTPRHQLYVPLGPDLRRASYAVVKLTRPAETALPALRAAVASMTPDEREAPRIHPLDEAFDVITAGRRANAALMLAFGCAVLAIGAVGVYAVVSAVVAQRRHEIGVRMVLGARPGLVVRQVMGYAMTYVSLGLILGLPAGAGLARLFDGLLFEVGPYDLSMHMATAIILLSAGLLAAALPARRASKVDPWTTIRST